MEITGRELEQAEERMAEGREAGYAVRARYDRHRSRIVVSLSTGAELAFPPWLAEGLADASENDLTDIEISPGGLGLCWPKLDADLYVPALLRGVFGSKKWMDRRPGAGETAAEFFKRRAKGHTGDDLDRMLDKVPDRPPEPGDELPEGWNPDTFRR